MVRNLLVAMMLMSMAICLIDAHGRMLKPPNRSSIWRIPEFAHMNPPTNYDDNQLYCGGQHQADDPGSNCGVCGDPASQPQPRANEIGGTYDKGIIVAEYQAGQVIDIEIDLTTSHLGNMEFRLCANPQNGENQNCFNQNVLQLVNGGTKLPAGPTGLMRAQVRLPQNVRCDRCVIQWNYRAGNGWPADGPQETFRGCSDVRIR